MKYSLDELFVESKPRELINVLNIEPRTVENNDIRSYNFTVDLTNLTSEVIDTKALFVKGDRESSFLKAAIIQNGAPFDLAGYTVTMNIKENSNELETYVCSIESEIEGKVLISLPARYVDEEGICTFELSFQKNGKVVVSQMYSYTVLGSLGEGVVGSEIEMTALQSLISQVQNEINTVTTITNELEITQTDIDDILGMVGGL